jgi:hypothetical protein
MPLTRAERASSSWRQLPWTPRMFRQVARRQEGLLVCAAVCWDAAWQPCVAVLLLQMQHASLSLAAVLPARGAAAGGAGEAAQPLTRH